MSTISFHFKEDEKERHGVQFLSEIYTSLTQETFIDKKMYLSIPLLMYICLSIYLLVCLNHPIVSFYIFLLFLQIVIFICFC